MELDAPAKSAAIFLTTPLQIFIVKAFGLL